MQRSSPGMKVRLVANKVDLEATADQEVVEAAWQIWRLTAITRGWQTFFCLHWICTAGQPYHGATWLLRRISGNHGICDLNFQELPALLCKVWHLPDIFPVSFWMGSPTAESSDCICWGSVSAGTQLGPDLNTFAFGSVGRFATWVAGRLFAALIGSMSRSRTVVKSRMDFREVSAVEFRGVREPLLLLQRAAVFLLRDLGMCLKWSKMLRISNIVVYSACHFCITSTANESQELRRTDGRSHDFNRASCKDLFQDLLEETMGMLLG